MASQGPDRRCENISQMGVLVPDMRPVCQICSRMTLESALILMDTEGELNQEQQTLIKRLKVLLGFIDASNTDLWGLTVASLCAIITTSNKSKSASRGAGGLVNGVRGVR